MTPAELAAYLERHSACHEAREWASGKSLAEAWKQCRRPDWMLWLCRSTCVIDHWLWVDLARLFAAEACDIAGAKCWSDLLRKCPTVVDEDTKAQIECYASAAREAIYLTADAADTAAWAAYAAVHAVEATAVSATYAAANAARAANFPTIKQVHARLCDIIRERIPYEAIASLARY